MKALVGSFNKEKALIGAFSVIMKSSQTFVWGCSIGEWQRRQGHQWASHLEAAEHSQCNHRGRYITPAFSSTNGFSFIVSNKLFWILIYGYKWSACKLLHSSALMTEFYVHLSPIVYVLNVDQSLNFTDCRCNEYCYDDTQSLWGSYKIQWSSA